MSKATRLKIEYMVAPLGIDNPNPRLTWNIEGGKQTAYSVSATGSLGSSFESGIINQNDMFCLLSGNFLSRERVNVSLTIYGECEKIQTTTTTFEMGITQLTFRH